jgi:hypothetical protein
MSDFVAAVNGALWVQTESGAIESYTTGLADTTEEFSLRVMTGPIKLGPAPLTSGRIRGVSVNGKVLDDHDLRVRVYADDRERVILNKTRAVTPEMPTKWPSGISPEFRTTQQRCAFAKVELIATPANGAEWTSIDIWAAGSQDRHPSRRRS